MYSKSSFLSHFDSFHFYELIKLSLIILFVSYSVNFEEDLILYHFMPKFIQNEKLFLTFFISILLEYFALLIFHIIKLLFIFIKIPSLEQFARFLKY
jgi:hypothetical protein